MFSHDYTEVIDFWGEYYRGDVAFSLHRVRENMLLI